MKKILKTKYAQGIVDTLGGELISYKNSGREYIWTGDQKYWSGHAPILFPFVGALKEDKVSFDGNVYTMKGKHGFARNSQFELTELNDSKAIFTLVSNEETKAQYPYDFALSIMHEISDTGFHTTYRVTNTGNKKMQFCIGGHAGFCTNGSAEDYYIKFEEPEDLNLYYTDEKSLFHESYQLDKRLESDIFPIIYNDFDVDAIIMKDTKSQTVKLLKKSDGSGIEFNYSGFHALAIWTPPHKKAPFICLEPWNGHSAYVDESGKFEDKPYKIVLPAGSDYSVGYQASVIK